MEVLESRLALSSLVLTDVPVDAAQPTDLVQLVIPVETETAQAPISITTLELRVNGQAVTIDRGESIVTLQPGDKLEVTGIEYRVDPGATGLSGVVAMEGYLRKMDGAGQSAFDYADGRFGEPDTDDPFASGAVLHSGLAGSWQVGLGDDRLVIALVRYSGDSAVTESRFFVNLRVGTPDFDLAGLNVKVESLEATVGKPLTIEGFWSNTADGRYRNYAEVDVFLEAFPKIPFWVGTLSGVAGPQGTVSGEFLNDNPNDLFRQRWVPLIPGKYVLRFTVDPEEIFESQTEQHNTLDVKLQVKWK